MPSAKHYLYVLFIVLLMSKSLQVSEPPLTTDQINLLFDFPQNPSAQQIIPSEKPIPYENSPSPDWEQNIHPEILQQCDAIKELFNSPSYQLLKACQKQTDLTTIKELINQGADPHFDFNRLTPMRLAIIHGNEAHVDYFVKLGNTPTKEDIEAAEHRITFLNTCRDCEKSPITHQTKLLQILLQQIIHKYE